MGEDGKVSVIIPVYNVERYLRRCVDSVTSQTFENLEIWLVDDGSTDTSGQICDDYSNVDKRIKVIHQNNLGLSGARNSALDRMTGKYVYFVDSDDFIRENTIRHLFEVMDEKKADMVIAHMEEGSEDSFPSRVVSYENDGLLSLGHDEAVKALFSDKYKGIMVPACGKLYRSELLSNIRFPIGKVHEDEFVAHEILFKCQKIVISDAVLYYHFKRSGSITNEPYSIRNLDATEAVFQRCEFFKGKGDRTMYFLAVRDYLRRVQWHYYSIKKYLPEHREEAEAIIQQYKSYYYDINGEMSFAEWIRYGLFIWCPGLNSCLRKMVRAKAV